MCYNFNCSEKFQLIASAKSVAYVVDLAAFQSIVCIWFGLLSGATKISSKQDTSAYGLCVAGPPLLANVCFNIVLKGDQIFEYSHFIKGV